jgi:glycerol-3-phosphate acyltransferase PlsY
VSTPIEETKVNILLSAVVTTSAYLLGSIPVGLLLTHWATGTDIREIGSGRTGGTNVLRVAGPWVALLTIVTDVAKGLLPVWLARAVVGSPAIEALVGLAAVVGHNYSIFISFKGGAGTMTTIGGAIGLWPWNGVILLVTGAAMVAITRHASVGSISITLALPLALALRAWLSGAPWAHLIHGLGAAALTLWALRPNIQRLLEGRERRITLGQKPNAA